MPPYNRASPFRRRIPGGAQPIPSSARLVRSLAASARDRGFVIAFRAYSVPVYLAGPNAPRYDVTLTAPWAPQRVLEDVPIPAAARPDPAEDGHLAIVDHSRGCEYDFWRARKRNGKWSAAWANVLPLNGDGIFEDGLSARASGMGLLAGLIFPAELRRGRIDHALVFSYPNTRDDVFVPPATSSDGESRRADALAEGRLVQLDPGLDLDTLDLDPYEKTIARALQEYGMYLGDTGGTLGVYAAHPQSFDGAYQGLLPPVAFPRLDGIPLERLRVLAPLR